MAWTTVNFDRTVTWADIAWIRDQWPGHLLLKGILDKDDVEDAVATGADAINVSNHGGRQLDGAPSSATSLPAIADVVRRRSKILADGGIRSGLDVVRMLALGADAALIGRTWAYGLAGGGGGGVAHVLELLRAEISVAMALAGCKRVTDIGDSILAHR